MTNGPTKNIIFLGNNASETAEDLYDRLIEEAKLEACPLDLPRYYLSVSQINMYRRCPRQYYFRYIKDLIRQPSAAQVEGSAIHKSVAVGHTEALKNGTVPLDVLLDAYNDYWKESKGEIDWKAEEDVVNPDLIVRRGHNFLYQYNDRFIPKLETRVDGAGPFVEREFLATIGKLHVPLRGFIDLVAKNNTVFNDKKSPDGSGEEEVIDHKTTSKSMSQDDVDSALQLTVYSRITGISHVRFQCFVKTKVPKISAIAARRTVQSWNWAEFVITEVARCISAGAFPPGPDGWSCSVKFCGYWDMCRGKSV